MQTLNKDQQAAVVASLRRWCVFTGGATWPGNRCLGCAVAFSDFAWRSHVCRCRWFRTPEAGVVLDDVRPVLPPISHFLLQSQVLALLQGTAGPPRGAAGTAGASYPIYQRPVPVYSRAKKKPEWGEPRTVTAGHRGGGGIGGGGRPAIAAWANGGRLADKPRGKLPGEAHGAGGGGGGSSGSAPSGAPIPPPLLLPGQLCLARTRFDKAAVYWPAVVLSIHDELQAVPEPPMASSGAVAAGVTMKRDWLYPVRFVGQVADWEVCGCVLVCGCAHVCVCGCVAVGVCVWLCVWL